MRFLLTSLAKFRSSPFWGFLQWRGRALRGDEGNLRPRRVPRSAGPRPSGTISARVPWGEPGDEAHPAVRWAARVPRGEPRDEARRAVKPKPLFCDFAWPLPDSGNSERRGLLRSCISSTYLLSLGGPGLPRKVQPVEDSRGADRSTTKGRVCQPWGKRQKRKRLWSFCFVMLYHAT